MSRRPRRYAKVLTVPIYKGRMYRDLQKAFKSKQEEGVFMGDYRYVQNLQEWMIIAAANAMYEQFGVNPFEYV